MAVSGVVGAKLGRLLGKANAAALVAHINADSGTASPKLSMRLRALLGRANADSIYALLGTGNSVQPKLKRRLEGLIGNFPAQHLVTEIESA